MAVYIERTEVGADKAPYFLWDNIFLDGTVTASSEATNGEVENALGDSTWDYWTPTGSTANINLSLSGSATVSALGIASHNLGTQNATISLDESEGTSSQLFSISPTDDSPILVLFDSTTANDFTFYIDSADSACSIGNIFLGDPLVIDNGILPGYTPLWMADNIELLESMSLSGQFFQNRIIKRSAQTNLSLNILDRSTVEGADFQNFRTHYNDAKTFFFAAGPSVFEDDISYCRRVSGAEIKPSFQQNGIFYNVQLGLEAFVG